MKLRVSILCAVSLALTVAGRPAAQTFFEMGNDRVPAEYGQFTVRSIRADSESPTLTLKYVRFPSTSTTPAAPLVFLAGGPGDAATRAFRGMPRQMLDSLTAIADVIAFDQRGTGLSEPANLVCPPVPGVPLDRAFDPAAALPVIRDRLAGCLQRVREAGVPIAAMTTQESADDVDELRRALGAKQLMLLAGSYGTHLALAVGRRHPDLVARMALLGVEGPDDTIKRPARVDATLQRIGERHPQILPALKTLLARLSSAPWTKTLPNGQAVTVGAWDLQRRVVESLDTMAEIDALPAALTAMLDGDYSDLVRWAIPFRVGRPMNVMNIAMDCASFATSARLADVASESRDSLVGSAINWPLPEICDTPGLPRLDDRFRAPINSAVPTLFVSGALDARTPPANVEALLPGFANGRSIVVPDASHDLFRSSGMSEALRFFRSGVR